MSNADASTADTSADKEPIDDNDGTSHKKKKKKKKKKEKKSHFATFQLAEIFPFRNEQE
jgi:hypothetical protein